MLFFVFHHMKNILCYIEVNTKKMLHTSVDKWVKSKKKTRKINNRTLFKNKFVLFTGYILF